MEPTTERVVPPSLRTVAFYLPQYHPIPENDAWWGAGFTEWTQVARSRPLFTWHQQPEQPADLGFYDLRVPEVREAQTALASRFGIDAFCYFHYWFEGRRVLERPFDEVLAFGRPDFPFCLCWANENWTRRWDGLDNQVLLAQGYSDEDDRNHIRWLLRAFEDQRYLRIAGRPLFLVYRASKLPDPRRTTSTWREEARRSGMDLFLCLVEEPLPDPLQPQDLGFDATVEFHPNARLLGPPQGRGGGGRNWLRRRLGLFEHSYDTAHVVDYEAYVKRVLEPSAPAYRRFRCAMPAWDNTPRRGKNSIIFRGSSPSLFASWLQALVASARGHEGESLIFINAWNEWGEGNHLEPCQRWGNAYLRALADALRESQTERRSRQLGEDRHDGRCC
jgi:lipopolysaccharide biosynthesis protein